MSKTPDPKRVIWRSGDRPTGSYASFHHQPWPIAYYGSKDGEWCAQLVCATRYSGTAAKSGEHEPITVMVADYSRKPFVWLTLKARAKNMAEAKALVADFLKRHPEVIPNAQG